MKKRRSFLLWLTGLAALPLGYWKHLSATSLPKSTGRWGNRENCSFVAELHANLLRDIESGDATLAQEKVALCPLCGDHITITAQS
jgi:hypothetical protein